MNGRDRRWAELARELEFSELPELRQRAEGWRAGLTGLSTLLAVLVVLKGRDDLAGLPTAARNTAMGLIAGAFVLLVVGSVLATRAAHGSPRDSDKQMLITGHALRQWTEKEVKGVSRTLRRAALCCLLGVLLAGGGVGVAWSTTEKAKDHLVRVGTPTGELCGELVRAGRGGYVVKVEEGGEGDAPRQVTLPARDVDSVAPVASCDAPG
ncbi:hypothetical protein [Streptomyces silvensis]|uniref:Uncharacterized protein n=1 Tax=Streptomyces silvensis TaxID=1765722 RepID=A0A0W7WU13_9ACTN|nr:hypothetical protein [Streptomyces silvensis]KUF14073.1 hypothetical protein AT728_02240 [Streptomyces silvensis]